MSLNNIMHVIKEVLTRFEEAQIPYMVVGSLSSIVYGEPRMTKDMDVVIDIPSSEINKFNELFPSEGFYCPPIEVLRDEIIQRGQFNLIHHESGLKVDIIVRKDSPHSREEFGRRRKTFFGSDFQTYIAAPEDVIIKKLEYYREGCSEKHIKDIKGILSQTQVDREYLKKWIRQLGLEKEWAMADS